MFRANASEIPTYNKIATNAFIDDRSKGELLFTNCIIRIGEIIHKRNCRLPEWMKRVFISLPKP